MAEKQRAGRPKKSPVQLRTHRVALAFSSLEMTRLLERADGEPLGSWARRVLLASLKPKTDDDSR